MNIEEIGVKVAEYLNNDDFRAESQEELYDKVKSTIQDILTVEYKIKATDPEFENITKEYSFKIFNSIELKVEMADGMGYNINSKWEYIKRGK